MRVGFISKDWRPYRTGREYRDAHVGRMPCEDRGRLWCEAAASLGTPCTAENHQKLGRGKGKFFPRLQRENGPDDSGFQTSSLQNCGRIQLSPFKPLSLWQFVINTVLSASFG